VHLIVLGTQGHGQVARFFMGSIAQRVVARCEVPVLLVK
jgi:nucleotide-binding universal stress UspA family protein